MTTLHVKSPNGTQKDINIDNIMCRRESIDVSKGDTPSSTMYKEYIITDNSGLPGSEHVFYDSGMRIYNNGNVCGFIIVGENALTGNRGELGIMSPLNGTPYAYAPTPANDDNSTNIATTAFVKSGIAYSYDGAWNSYVNLGNHFGNLLIQFGLSSGSSSNDRLITFPVAFKSTDSYVMSLIQDEAQVGVSYTLSCNRVSESQFRIRIKPSDSYYKNIHWMAIGLA